VGRLKKKRVTLEQLEQLALEHPRNTEEEKKELLSLIVEYNDVDRLFISSLNVKIVGQSDMENFERLSNKVLIRTCPCGIIFKTYDPKKVYHSNSCRASYVRERYGVMIVQRRKLKQKKLEEKTKE
jgi:hypothetical protein